ncbi:MAG: dihydrodipicolinate synthase family protein [Edaphobacter sp.]|nr:dihydrodipicolinate synthase family protein [Edaphobacter sp.]
MLLEGLQLPLTTPFYPDGRLNLPKLEHNAARYSKTPVAGLVALSDSGEPTMLSEEEIRQTLRSVAEAAAPEKVLMAGVSRDSVVGTLDLAERAAEFQYDAVLVKRPSIFGGDAAAEHAKALLTYFQVVADRSPLPVVLHSAATIQGGMLPVEVVIELAGHPQIIGLVEGASGRERIEALREVRARVKREVAVTAVFAAVTGRMRVRDNGDPGGLIAADTLTGGGAALAVAPTKAVARTRTKVVGFQVLGEHTTGMLEALRGGAVGAMPAFAASAPQACYEVLAAWRDGDQGLAQEKQARLQSVAQKVEEQLGVAGIKFGCDLNGYFGGRPRLPLLPLTGEEQVKIEALMQGMRH